MPFNKPETLKGGTTELGPGQRGKLRVRYRESNFWPLTIIFAVVAMFQGARKKWGWKKAILLLLPSVPLAIATSLYAYTAPTTRSTGDLITASIWNTDVVDNIIFLHARKVILLQAVHPNNSTQIHEELGSIRSATSEELTMTWFVPADYSSLDVAKIVYIPSLTSTATFQTHAWFGAEGAAFDTHTASDTTHSVAETADEINSVDITGLLGSLAANDYLIATLKGSGAGNAVEMGVFGLHIEYTRS